ncbi:VOC family protein [Pseudonocardia sp. TRM90224]|uniref:VOC family protein n=1 Tax=Pseudonocardia sp. TRM90224 TaxID=2812678 RepID=UPI001E30DBC2|nr:VOC family protein [Pseudonocardia sp. TRM90224]
MTTTYVGLPVSDLARATEFFTALGFTTNPYATDERTAAIVISDQTWLMLNGVAFFEEYTGAAAADPATHREVSVGFSAPSRERVDEIVDRAIAAGGGALGTVDDGPMYMRAFTDLDGHYFSVIFISEYTP